MSEQSPMILLAPWLHGELAPGAVSGGFVCFNPGVAVSPEQEEGMFSPDNLPLAPDVAAQMVRDMLEFGLQFKNAGDIAGFAPQGRQGGGDALGAGLRSEFHDLDAFAAQQVPSLQPEEQAVTTGPNLFAAQQLLLLAWATEERLLELQNLGDGYKDTFAKFNEALGLDEDESEIPAQGAELADDLERELAQLPWALVLESMICFLEPGVTLLCSNPDMLATWRDLGLELTPLSDEQAKELPAGLVQNAEAGFSTAEAPGWLLAGLRHADKEKSWLDKTFQVLACE